ncbi:hypothetical protein DL546_002573 [Coniochaeta pulveracea]|uniref:Uncharacterized protein n=1 Tax=Coniochaeta pulveracea TaxID=177199 RepID=A0A420XZK9_9PEZI|nr:hypothetical protein DL546_002573 [Coniochaeta pulveracea]
MSDDSDGSGRGGSATGPSSSFPSYEERQQQELANGSEHKTNISPDARRIRWALNGPLETSISVVQCGRVFDPEEVPEPYYLGDKEDHEGGPACWHSISRSPLSEPRVSSVKVVVDPLDEWDRFWMDVHEGHTDPDATYDPAEVLYEPLPPAERDANLEDKKLLRCCGEDRPLGKESDLIVRGTGEGGFVTIHDFLSVVHPYLLSRRDEILEAMELDGGRSGKRPFERETKLMVMWLNPGYLDIQTEYEWMRSSKAFSKVKAPPLPPPQLTILPSPSLDTSASALMTPDLLNPRQQKKRGAGGRNIVPVSGYVNVGGAPEGHAQAPRTGLFEAAMEQVRKAEIERIANGGDPDSAPKRVQRLLTDQASRGGGATRQPPS